MKGFPFGYAYICNTTKKATFADQMQKEKKIFTLTKLGIALEKHVKQQFGQSTYWVTAEVAKINSKSGHYYLQLADSEENVTTAEFNAYLWASNVRKIKTQIGEDFNAILQRGNNVLFLVKIEFNKRFGLNLAILDIDPTYTYGEIEKRKQETIARLKEEGLFDKQHQRYFPTLSKRIAIVASPESSGYRDFKEELYNNTVYRRFTTKTFASSVQGERAKEELISALKEARCYDVDVIVLLRGGGSKMDLAVFNEYDLCKEICLTEIPVITGIGHETDEVVADLVARMNFITPTAVARHLYVQIGNFNHFLTSYYGSIKTKTLEVLSEAKDHFNHLNNYVVHHSQSMVKSLREQLNKEAFSVSRKSQHLLHSEKETLTQTKQHVYNALSKTIATQKFELEKRIDTTAFQALRTLEQERNQTVVFLFERIMQHALNSVQQEGVNLENLSHMLTILNPEKLLQAGYTITAIEGIDISKYEGDLIGKEAQTLTDKLLIKSKIETVETLKK